MSREDITNVTPPVPLKKIRAVCINADGCAWSKLKVGEIYTISVYDNACLVHFADGAGYWFEVSRFEELVEEPEVTPKKIRGECTVASQSAPPLEVGKVYDLIPRNDTTWSIEINGKMYYYCKSRFEVLDEPVTHTHVIGQKASEWFGYKYRVTAETSKLLQEAVFKDGGRWKSDDTNNTMVEYLNGYMYYFVTNEGIITRSNYQKTFNDSELPKKDPPYTVRLSGDILTKKIDWLNGTWVADPPEIEVCMSRDEKVKREKINSKHQLYDDSCSSTYYKDQKFVVVDGLGHNVWENGDVLIISRNDWDIAPFFRNVNTGDESKCWWSRLAPLSPVKMVKCIDTKCTSNLTLRKIYDVVKENSEQMCVINDNGVEECFRKSRFEEIRYPELTTDKEDSKMATLTKLDTGKLTGVYSPVENTITWDTNTSGKIDTSIEIDWPKMDSLYKSLTTTKEESKMGINSGNRRVVDVKLLDNDKGLPVEHSLVGQWDGIVTEDDNATTINEILMTGEVATYITQHNEVRGKEINLDILDRTGNEVKLRPVKLKDLTWIVS